MNPKENIDPFDIRNVAWAEIPTNLLLIGFKVRHPDLEFIDIGIRIQDGSCGAALIPNIPLQYADKIKVDKEYYQQKQKIFFDLIKNNSKFFYLIAPPQMAWDPEGVTNEP